jgi:hypothetical protein
MLQEANRIIFGAKTGVDEDTRLTLELSCVCLIKVGERYEAISDFIKSFDDHAAHWSGQTQGLWAALAGRHGR